MRAPSEASYEHQADRLLGCLYGYARRQEHLAEDTRFLANLLRSWDDEVNNLSWRLDKTRDALTDSQRRNRQYEWRMAGKG